MLFFLFRWKLNSKQKLYITANFTITNYMHRPAAHHKHNALKWFIFLVKLHESVHLLFWIPTKKSLNWSFFFFFFLFWLLLLLLLDVVCRALLATRSVVELSHSLSLMFFFLQFFQTVFQLVQKRMHTRVAPKTKLWTLYVTTAAVFSKPSNQK